MFSHLPTNLSHVKYIWIVRITLEIYYHHECSLTLNSKRSIFRKSFGTCTSGNSRGIELPSKVIAIGVTCYYNTSRQDAERRRKDSEENPRREPRQITSGREYGSSTRSCKLITFRYNKVKVPFGKFLLRLNLQLLHCNLTSM